MADDVAIKVEHVSKDFVLPHEKVTRVKDLFTSVLKRHTITNEKQHALKDVSFEIKKGEFFGIVGRNGSGKSTMLKMLAGIYQPTKGKIHVNGKLVPFIELGVGFNPELTGRENVYLNGAMMGFSEKQTDAMYNEIVAFAELEDFMDQKLKNYSSGMQVRLAFSVAIKAEAEILLVDEVLAVGDAAFQRKCFQYFKLLKKQKKTVVFVTHEMNAVREFCDRALLIDRAEIRHTGDPQIIAKEYAQLFIGGDDGAGVNAGQRWGTGDAKYTNVRAKLVGGNIEVDATAKVLTRPIDGLIYGIHILSADGKEVTALNNRMINAPDINDASIGTEAQFSWSMLNIFSDGEYSITLTLVDDEQTPLDWYNGAASFVVKRSERSVTAVIPPISVSSKVTKPRGK